MRRPSLAFLLLATLPTPNAAQEPAATPPAPSTRLTYEMPVDAMQRSLRGRSGDLETLLADTIAALQIRVGDRAAVARHGATGFTVTMSGVTDDESAALRRRIECRGTLEFRIVAGKKEHADDFPFDLDGERARLQAWLDAGGAAQVRTDPDALSAFHADAERGPIAAGKLRWCVHRVPPRADAPTRWMVPMSQLGLGAATVPLFRDADWQAPVPPTQAGEPAPCLLELVALDLHQRGFDQTTLRQDRVKIEGSPLGKGVLYELSDEHRADYVVWTAHNVGRCCGVLLDGELITAPRFVSKIQGKGLLAGNFDTRQVEYIASALRSGALPAQPQLVGVDHPAPSRK